MKIKKLNLFWNISRIIRWIPVLWNNFDWDGDFLNRIVIFKLGLMIENTYKWFVEDAEKCRAQMNIARNYLVEASEIDLFEKDDYKRKQKLINDAYMIIAENNQVWWD